MSPVTYGPVVALARFPRVSGDEPGLALSEGIVGLFSPRERG